jgi:hypothetical protein
MWRTRSDPANICWSFIMPDFSLVPVDHQPDFSDVSLVPVDHDPFSADDIIQRTRGYLESQPQRLATVAGPANAGVPANNVAADASGESYDPDSPDGVPGSGQPYGPSAAPISPSDKPTADWSQYNQPFGELRPATYTPTQHIGNFAASALTGLGMQPYTANDLTSRVGNLLGLTPLGIAGSALDLIGAKRRDELPGVVAAAAGMIPGAKGVGRGVAKAVHLHHAWPKYLGGAVKQELVPLPKALHYEFHRELDKQLPKRLGTAHYESLGPTEKQQALQKLATYTKNFDAEHGTKLYDALLKNGFPAP